MYALTRRISEHQNMDQNVWKKRIKAAAIRLEGVMLLGSMAVVQMHATEDFELIIDDVFTIMGVGTVATGNISTGMCREGENACVYKTNGGVLETILACLERCRMGHIFCSLLQR